MFDPFEQRLEAEWPVASWGAVTCIVAVSGGADSVALLRALTQIRNAWIDAKGPGVTGVAPPDSSSGRLLVMHINHHLRGEHSLADQEFVMDLAKTLGLPCVVHEHRADSLQASIEERCRKARYAALREQARVAGARFIVTAHQRNDQIETLLFRTFRGSSVTGIAGISRFREIEPGVTLARPLLDCSHEEVLSYLARSEQSYRHDASNQNTEFARNWIRNELLPMVRQRFGTSVDAAVARLAKSAAEQTKLLEQLIDRWLEQATESTSPVRVHLDVRIWQAQSEVLIRSALVRLWKRNDWPQQAMTAEHWQRAAMMIQQSTPTRSAFPNGIELHLSREGHWVLQYTDNRAEARARERGSPTTPSQ